MLLTHSHLGRSYQLLRRIGNREMGSLYLAQDTRVLRQVAVKVVLLGEESRRSSAVVQRVEELFYDKMQAIAQLDHPHILPVFDFGLGEINKSQCAYVVMEYCPAGSLEDWLLQTTNVRTCLALSEVAGILSQAARALQFAHERGILHQDIKPANFLVRVSPSSSDQPGAAPDLRITDFWIACFFATMSHQGLSQSPYIRSASLFIAPEQWDGQAVAASDQYALAVMAFHLLTGQFPFQGSLSKVIYQHHYAQPPEPSSFNPQLDPFFDEIIKRALAKQPEKRYPSMLDFAQACAGFQPSPGVQGPQLLSDSHLSPEPVSLASSPEPSAQPASLVGRVSPEKLAAFPTQLAPATLDVEGDEALISPSTQVLPDTLSAELVLLAQEPALDATPANPASPKASADVAHDGLTVPAPASSEPVAVPLPEPANADAFGEAGQAGRPGRSSSTMPTIYPFPIVTSPGLGSAAAQATIQIKSAPELPDILSWPSINRPAVRHRNASALRKSLLLALVGVLLLVGSGLFLFKGIAGSGGPQASSNGQGRLMDRGNGTSIIIYTTLTPGQTTTAPGSTSAPSNPSKPGSTNSGSAPKPTPTPATSSSTAQPTANSPVPTPTPRPTPTPTPKPTPHPCLIHNWLATLSPTYFAGGTAFTVSSYCGGNVYLTLTAAPASHGHEVDLQICYGLRTTNCSPWVKYAGVNVWLHVASGLKAGQVFYVNGRCTACTGSAFGVSGSTKY